MSSNPCKEITAKVKLRVVLWTTCPPVAANLECSARGPVRCHEPGTFRVQLKYKDDYGPAWTLVCDKHFQAVVLWPTYIGSPDVVDDSENTDD